MTVLAAPERMGRRDQARELLSTLPDSLDGQVVEVMFSEGSVGTPSFLDELVLGVLRDRAAAELQLIGLPESLRAVAVDSAADAGLSSRLLLH